MFIDCFNQNWRASILCSDEVSPDGIVHFEVRTLADTKEDALKAAQYMFKILTGGRESFVRAYPEAYSETDFDSKEIRHGAYARFGVLTTPDKQTDLTKQIAQLPLSAA
jgi:hypothetical protein